MDKRKNYLTCFWLAEQCQLTSQHCLSVASAQKSQDHRNYSSPCIYPWFILYFHNSNIVYFRVFIIFYLEFFLISIFLLSFIFKCILYSLFTHYFPIVLKCYFILMWHLKYFRDLHITNQSVSLTRVFSFFTDKILHGEEDWYSMSELPLSMYRISSKLTLKSYQVNQEGIYT